MKVNKFGMLIKFALLYLCINNFIVISAIPLDDQNADKQPASVETSESDYDAMSDKPTEASSSETKPPLVFPSDDDKSTSKNETALEILQKNSNTSAINENSAVNGTNIDKENDESQKKVDRLEKDQESSKDENSEQPEDGNKKTEDTSDKDYENVSQENNADDKDDAENIQENKDQGDLEERYGVNSTSINVFEEPTLKGGHVAFIFAACIVFLSITAYVGFILWRKSAEHRYGMRQRLVTEDDYYNNNDVRFFGL